MADPEILVLGGPERDLYLAPTDLERLDSFAKASCAANSPARPWD